MPPAEQWESYFDPERAIQALCGDFVRGDAVEFGCGYGTFTIPSARRVSGIHYALDIDPMMVAATAARAARHGLGNTVVEQRDFAAEGCGRASQSAGAALLFNILHIENPLALLEEAHRVLRAGAVLAIIHWKHDARTPRGPPLDIRPRPQDCRGWAEAAGFSWVRDAALPGSPWHWGLLMDKPAADPDPAEAGRRHDGRLAGR